MNHLEQLVAEWFEYNGYFVRRNIRVGRREKGGYECELDVVAFCPTRKHLVHVEPSLDCHSLAKREQRYKAKFEAGRKYIPKLFSGFEILVNLDQVVVLTYGGKTKAIAGGRVIHTRHLFHEINRNLLRKTISSQMISEQFPLLRTIQHCLEYGAGDIISHEYEGLVQSCNVVIP